MQSFYDDGNITDGVILDMVLKLGFLAVNGCLELLRVHQSKLKVKKKIAVILDETRNIVNDINKAFGVMAASPFVSPNVSNKNTLISDSILMESRLRYTVFSIGGKQFYEVTPNVNEVYYFPVKELSAKTINIRGQELIIINAFEKLSSGMPKGDFLPVLWVTTQSGISFGKVYRAFVAIIFAVYHPNQDARRFRVWYGIFSRARVGKFNIQLAIRLGQYKKLNAMSIKEGELFRFDPLEEEIEVQPD